MTAFISLLESNHLKTQSENTDLFGTVAGGKQSAGKPNKNWVDCLEEDCARANMPMDRKGEKPNHLAEINLVPNLCQEEIGPLLFI
jgi:hypothetical protein